MLLLYLVAVVVLLCFIYYRIALWKLEKCVRNLPGDRTLPLIGNAAMFFKCKNMSDVWYEARRFISKYEETKIAKFWFGPILGVFLWDPSYVEEIANSPYISSKGPLYMWAFGEICEGAFVSNGQKCRELRRPLSRTFTRNNLENNTFEVFLRRSKHLCQILKKTYEGECFNAVHWMSNHFLDVFSETHLGVNLNALERKKDNFFDLLDDYLELTFAVILKYHIYFWKIGAKYISFSERRDYCCTEIMNFSHKILNQRKKEIKTSNEKPLYYTDFLLQRQYTQNISKEESARALTDLIIGSSDTSGVVTSTALLFVAMFPEVQEQVYLEQAAIFGDSDRDPTPEDMANMKYLDMVVKETLRKVAPPGVIRACAAQLNVGEYTIPKGAVLYFNLFGLHNDPRHWERPDFFYPEHFLPEKVAARPRSSYMPFGFGARLCPGYRYGLLGVKTLLSTICRQFKISTPLKYDDLVLDYKLLIHVKSGYHIKLDERSKNSISVL